MKNIKRSRKRKETIYNMKLIAVGVGMLVFSKKLQSYGSTPTLAAISEVKAETAEVESAQNVVSIENLEEYGKNEISFYQVPFGELPENIQIYTNEICEQYGLPTEIVFAIMQNESRFDSEAVGDDGQSFGYMQVMKKWHEDRMKKLGVEDLRNPKENILVAVDYISELYQKYGDMTSTLMAYNCGPSTAQKLWNQGIYQTEYTSKVLGYSEEIRSEIFGGTE